MPRRVWQWQCVLGGVCRLPGYWWTCAAAPAEACDVATAQEHRCGDSPDAYAAELQRAADAKATGAEQPGTAKNVSVYQPGIEPGSHRWQRCILPLDH